MYPLKFEPVYKDYIWGGREFEKFGKKLPKGIVAESWEISGHPEGESVIANGEYKGLALTEIVKKLGRTLVGNELAEKDINKFPLLIKLIDANDRLSVQVHPEDEYARINENGEYGKNEMWYIVSAKPGSKLVYGVAPGVTKEKFIKAVEEDRIEECLNFIEVKTGDVVNIPAGLVHAIGNGLVIVEIQQNSNTTYRVFDYNRVDKEGKKRPLHIEKALEVINFNNCDTTGKQKGIEVKLGELSAKTYYVANKYFSVEKYIVKDMINENADGDKFITYTCLDGEGMISYEGGCEKISKGESVLIPAAMGKYKINGELELIKSYVPNLYKDVIEPLIKEGYSREIISSNVL